MQKLISTGLGLKAKESDTNLMNGIFAFEEQPSLNCPRKKEEPGNMKVEINASELFSLFTANIIKEKIIFTR